MKTKTIERIVNFNSDILHVLNVHSDDELYYFDENLGKRCKGSIQLYGQVDTTNGKQSFQDEVFLDVFAPKTKLKDHYQIKCSKIDHEIMGNQLKLLLTLQIEGIADEEVKSKKSDYLESLEQMFDQETMSNLCTLHVVKEDDTYASIAYEYQVEESTLREYNQHKNLEAKMLVMIPS